MQPASHNRWGTTDELEGSQAESWRQWLPKFCSPLYIKTFSSNKWVCITSWDEPHSIILESSATVHVGEWPIQVDITGLLLSSLQVTSGSHSERAAPYHLPLTVRVILFAWWSNWYTWFSELEFGKMKCRTELSDGVFVVVVQSLVTTLKPPTLSTPESPVNYRRRLDSSPGSQLCRLTDLTSERPGHLKDSFTSYSHSLQSQTQAFLNFKQCCVFPPHWE